MILYAIKKNDKYLSRVQIEFWSTLPCARLFTTEQLAEEWRRLLDNKDTAVVPILLEDQTAHLSEDYKRLLKQYLHEQEKSQLKS